jgi:Na+-transporting methylmalonyl-CoA/oxaloacetate decarboxylase gamma subunit
MISTQYSLRRRTSMAKKIYYNGKLIPAKDWDYDRKRPKVKEKKAEVIAEPETQVEVVAEVVEAIIEELKD